MVKTIVLTGGGTAGHVTPNIALIEAFQSQNWNVAYIGSSDGVEKRIISNANIPFYPVSSGKLRRYFSWKNFTDPFNIIKGIFQSFRILGKEKPAIVFSKGGFVAVPVVIAAWLKRIPVIAHESDMSPGLANKICYPFVKKICLNFSTGKQYFKNPNKTIVTGTPIRSALFKGSKDLGLKICGFNSEKPCLLVMGGSLGAQSINKAIRNALDKLTESFQVIHLCGKNNLDEAYKGHKDYKQFEYVDDEMPHLLAAADVIISRSGANTVSEIIALHKPHIFVPLSKKASRGDQIQNANYFKEKNVSYVIDDEALSSESLLSTLKDVKLHYDELVSKMKSLQIKSATDRVVQLIKEQSDVRP